MKTFFSRYRWQLLLIVFGVFALLDLLHPGLPLTHDGKDHVARIANFYQNLQDGNIIPRWAPNLNWGYGHPILMFLYPLPSYLASLFHSLSFSLVDSFKLVFGLTFLVSGIAMFLFVREITDEFSGFVAGLLYMYAPYRFVDMYVRGAIGEHVAFVFPPLILYFFLLLSKRITSGRIVGASLSIAGLLLSHNALTLMFLPVVFLYCLYLLYLKKQKKKFAASIISAVLLGFGLSAFFVIPAFFEGKYTLRDIVTSGGEYIASFVKLEYFFIGEWNYGGSVELPKQVGIIHWLGILGSLGVVGKLFKLRRKEWMIVAGALGLFVLSLFLMLKISDPIWQFITILQKFQFPWRFLSVTVFLSAFLAGITFNHLFNKRQVIVGIVLVVITLFLHKEYWYAEGYLQQPESAYTQIYHGTTDTGESAPLWSVRFMEKEPKHRIEVLEGKATIEEIERYSTKHVFLVNAAEETTILENTLYFPGWSIYVNGVSTNIQFQDRTHHGVMEFSVPKGQSRVTVQFEETKLRMLSNFITLGSILALFGYTVYNSRNLARRKVQQ